MACAAGKPTAQPVRLRYVVYPKPTGRGFVSCGPMQWRDGPKWVKTPDEREEPVFEAKRRQSAPVLAKVAAKAKREKLPRLNLREPWQVAKVKP
jgi:hypothetical protein